MLSPYFVVSRGSGNIIRVTRRDKPPAGTATVFSCAASAQSLERYEQLHARGQDLISLASLSPAGLA